MNIGNRIFVEKRPGYRVEADSLRHELNSNLGLDIRSLRLLCVYDLFGFTPSLMEESKYRVFGEAATDVVTEGRDLTDLFGGECASLPSLAIEALPGQFDARAASAVECVRLLDPKAQVEITSARLIIFDDSVDAEAMQRIEKYCINAVESRRKDLSLLQPAQRAEATAVKRLDGFRKITADKAPKYVRDFGLAMNADDLMEVVKYFQAEDRDPNETELRILDTYWSDHCRHTTFTSALTDIEVMPGFASEDINAALEDWHATRRELGREEKTLCLMDLATIGARYLRRIGKLEDLEVSEENNACSIYIDVETEKGPEKWLLQFKNETHNHPTEIEPFGGASTCLGGAIRDPLSGRSYVYQAMRVTGAADIYAPVADTLPGKLPQRVISLRAAAGYSSYGNQIGLATTHVREIYHPGYVAKRLEVGAVVGAVKAEDVRRESPAPGDIVLMFGGRTGRDGIGGATGSSKEHDDSSLEECGSEVQKGNAPEERKISRLFRRPEVTRLIKKSNDFGAGGVSVAIGELADSLDIYLDRVTTKYSGLNATELAISESQERMSVVIEPKDREEFERYCREENIEVHHVADITDSGRMRMMYKGEMVADISREFINSAGAPHFAQATISGVDSRNPFLRTPAGETLADRLTANMADENVTMQRGLIEMFDSSIGRSTVLMPFGGHSMMSETQVSVQTLPVKEGNTRTASMMAFGFMPTLMTWSPFHGGAYAVVEAVAKAVAAGADRARMRFSYQEYFEKMSSREAWGKPLAALLGTLRIQKELELPSIGGKDSMSGTFNDINVPPTLIAFGIAPVNADETVSTDLKKAGHSLWLLRHTPTKSLMPDSEALKTQYEIYHRLVKEGKVLSAWAVGFGGIAEGLAKMSFGNRVGARIVVGEDEVFSLMPGSIIFETENDTDLGSLKGFEKIGVTTDSDILRINGTEISIETMLKANTDRFHSVYPHSSGVTGKVAAAKGNPATQTPALEEHCTPTVYLPVFPGTNCDYDMRRAFEREGAKVTTSVFCNLTAEDIERSAQEMAAMIDSCQILALSGGFSAGDEPDGSGKFIANVLLNDTVKSAIERLQARGGLILGICNGFQALVKSGLLPFGRIGDLTPDSPTLFRNDINRHISQVVRTRVATTHSPWLQGFEEGETHMVAASHGEGKFMASPELAAQLAENGQIAFQYVDEAGMPTMESPHNPNGSTLAIEGIISPDGRILGKMAHSERYDEHLMRNIYGNRDQNLFRNAVRYFTGK